MKRIRLFAALLLCAAVIPVGAQQAAKVFSACYVPLTGTVYRVNEADLRPSCTSTSHVLFSWTDGFNAIRTTDVAGGDLTGPFSSLTVARLLGRPLSTVVPSAGQFLGFNGTSWTPSPAPAGGSLPTTSSGAFDFSNNSGFVAFGGAGPIPATGAGTRIMWYPAKAAFRAGELSPGEYAAQWDDARVGEASVALGMNTRASGVASFAAGQNSSAEGGGAIALGQGALANGGGSIALGPGGTTASGFETIAIGSLVRAIGLRSMVLGRDVETTHTGAIIFGAGADGLTIQSSANNEFAVRAGGGFRFRSSGDLTTGCNLPAGSGTWACTSSRLAKTGFASLNGADVLAKIEGMPIQAWSYRTEPGTVRHVGPTAQDFRAAFGLGTGDESISLVDIDGINMLGVQTLARKARDQAREIERLRAQNAKQTARLDVLEKAIARLGAARAPKH